MSARAVTLLDRRMLAAIRPIDPLGRVVDGLVSVSAEGARFLHKPDGIVILTRWSGLPGADQQFDAPVAPVPASRELEITLRPARRDLLPRRAVIDLPRDPDPARATTASSLFRAIDVAMPASTAFAVSGHSAAIAVRVVQQGSQVPVFGAVIRASLPGTPAINAVGLTDRLGEAMLVLPGLPLTQVGPGASVQDSHEITLALFVDADLAVRARDALRVGETPEPVDPDQIMAEPGNAGDTASVTLRAGRSASALLEWSPP